MALGKPVFVTRIDPQTREVWLGENQELFKTGLIAERVNYVSGTPFTTSRQVTAKIRSAAPRVEATATSLDDQRLEVVFAQPQRAITPGQAVVIYDGDQVLAGGTIAEIID
jgi:tRNA-specific 2-thiouridylase